MWGRRQGAEVPTDGAETQEPLASHCLLQAQRKEGRGPTPESPLYSSSQSPDRGNPWSSSTEGQAARGDGASEQGSFTSPQCKQSDFTGWGAQDRLMVCDLYLHMWPKEAPKGQVGRNRPRDCRAHSKPHLLSASLIPEPREGREQQTGCVTQRVGSDLWTMRVLSAFLPGSRPHGKVERQEQFPSAIWGSA